MKNYEINEETIAVIPIGYEKTKIIEKNREYIVEKKAYNIMDDSCKYYGSSYKGRLNAAKEILNCSYKLPILVEESNTIIFFPTKSSLEDDCWWINFNAVEKVEKTQDDVLLYLNNNDVLKVNCSKLSVNNQLLRSTKLGYIINQRINKIKNS